MWIAVGQPAIKTLPVFGSISGRVVNTENMGETRPNANPLLRVGRVEVNGRVRREVMVIFEVDAIIEDSRTSFHLQL